MNKRYPTEYSTWCNMKSRCNNPRRLNYKYYGGRGIRVCDEWAGADGFERFLAHIGPKPSPRHSVDRIDNARGYEPGNVRWATAQQQVRNQRNRPLREVPDGLCPAALQLGRMVGVY